MSMGQDKGVDITYTVDHGLGAEIGSAVYQEPGGVGLEVNAGAHAFVFRISRMAYGATATKGGHAGAGAGTKDGYTHGRMSFRPANFIVFNQWEFTHSTSKKYQPDTLA